MSDWNDIYSEGCIHTKPSKEIIELVPRLKNEKVRTILDAGCGTGRHTIYLAQQGFYVHGIDISKEAIRIARSNKNGHIISYTVGTLTDLPYPRESIDFILANHSLQYASLEDIRKSITKLNGVLRSGRPFFARVASTKHPFYNATPDEVYGFSHIGFCIKNNLPVHFFEEEELRSLFKGYNIERLEHITHDVDHDKITVPLNEWVLLGYKN